MTVEMSATCVLPEGLADLAGRLSASFIKDIRGVGAVVVATVDGFAIASAFERANDAHRIAAMASSISAIGSVVALEAGLGAYRSVTINTDAGFVVVQAVQRPDLELVINVIADSDAILAQVLLRLKSMVAKLLA
jgi:uncharacterized protein